MIRRSLLALLACGAIGTVLVVGATLPAMAESPLTPLVSAQWLASSLEREDVAVIDIRGKVAEEAFVTGHVPGAVWSLYSSWRSDGAIASGDPAAAAVFEALISGLGIANDTTVVIVPAGSSASEFAGAARVYWSFKYVGHDDVAILDGGWAAWLADATNPVETGPTTPVPASFTATLRPELLATTSAVSASLGTDTILIDARPPEQYLGQSKSPGHIPGALNISNALFYDAGTNRIKPVAELETFLPAALASKDVNIVSYCNGGHLGATDWFVLHEVLGFQNVALYADSMGGWTKDPNNPVEQ